MTVIPIEQHVEELEPRIAGIISITLVRYLELINKEFLADMFIFRTENSRRVPHFHYTETKLMKNRIIRTMK